MGGKPGVFEISSGRIAAGLVFVLVLLLADWVVHAASFVIFKFYPAAVPDSFFIAQEDAVADDRGLRHDFVSWQEYARQPGNRTLLLAVPAGRIRSKGDSMSFEVLEMQGEYRLIEVTYDGAYRSHSRYVVYGNRRAVPVAYRSYGWGDALWSHAAVWVGAVLLAGLAAWGTLAGVRRLSERGSSLREFFRSRRLAEFAAGVAFFGVLICTPWIVYLASLVIFRLDPGAAPETFAVVYRTVDERYAVTRWPAYPRAVAGTALKTFRLPGSGFVDGPKVRYSFRVLDNDASRQVIEVQTHGVISAVSRYAVRAERIEPISYRGLSWGWEHATFLPASLIAVALAALAAWSAFAAASRLTRLQQT